MTDTKVTPHFRLWHTLIVLLIISVALENLKIGTILGASLKITHVIIILFILSSLLCINRSLFADKIKRKEMFLGIAFLLLPLIPLYRINDKLEWTKSYAIYVLIVSFFSLSLRNFIREFGKGYQFYVRLFLYVIAFTQVLGVIQFICMNYFGYFFLEGIFGPFQFHINYYGMSGGFYRAYSLYHEPSVFGWVTTTSFAVIMYTGICALSRKERLFLLALDFAAIIIAISASSMVIMAVLMFVYQLTRTSDNRIKLLSVIGLFAVAVMLWNFTEIPSPLRRIWTETLTPNTSGYERLMTPLLYLRATFQNFPILGRGLGQEGMVDAVGIIGHYTAINNSLIGIIVHFGLSSLCFYVFAIVASFKKIAKNRLWLMIVLNLLGIYISTGAYISMDTFIFLILLIAVGNKPEMKCDEIVSNRFGSSSHKRTHS